MRKISYFLIILSLCSGILFAQENTYIPRNLDECFVELKKAMPPEELAEFKSKGEEDVISYHLGMGMWIRNNWHLWGKEKSPLRIYFNKLGIYHPDDMSGIVLMSFHRHLNGQDIKLDEQVKPYKEYWKNAKKTAPKKMPVPIEAEATGETGKKIANVYTYTPPASDSESPPRKDGDKAAGYYHIHFEVNPQYKGQFSKDDIDYAKHNRIDAYLGER